MFNRETLCRGTTDETLRVLHIRSVYINITEYKKEIITYKKDSSTVFKDSHRERSECIIVVPAVHVNSTVVRCFSKPSISMLLYLVFSPLFTSYTSA